MKKKILIIEDDLSMRTLLTFILEKKYDVAPHSTAQSAIRYLNLGNIPDLIISDAKMPEMPGLELVEYLKTSLLFNRIPIVIVSSLDKSSDRNQFYNAGVDEFIKKPFDPVELDIRINYLLNLRTTYS